MAPRQESVSISRRDFIKFGGLLAGSGLLVFMDKWGLTVPGAVPETNVVPFEPGWLEKRNHERPAFITGNQDGHREYLRYMSTHDELLVDILHEAYTDLMKVHETRPSISDTFKQHIKYAKYRLGPLGATRTDQVHVAFFTMAAVYNDLFTPKNIKDYFHITIPVARDQDDNHFWIVKFVGNMPKVFDKDYGTEHGIDKVFHFANFAFIVHEYWYANRYGLLEATCIPNAARLVAATAGDAKKSAVRLAALGQYVWESYETLDWMGAMFDQRRVIWPPAYGLFDPDIGGDLRANKLGRIVGALLARVDISDQYLAKILHQLRNPEKLLTEFE